MNSDYYINLHFNQAIPQKTGYAFKIGDKGCTFHLHCVDLDPTGMDPHIVFNHINGTCVEGVPTGSGHDYVYVIAGNEFGVCGLTVVDLKFYDSSNPETQRISTASFTFEVLPDTLTPFDEASSSYADSLEHAREEIDAAILELQGAEHDLEEAETDLDNMSDQFEDTLQDYIDAFGNTGPINPRGEYDPQTEYHPRDSVSYTAGGKTLTYINRETCTGIAPTDPDYGARYWQIMIDVAVGGALSALEDVSIDPQTLADGQMLRYNDTLQKWENEDVPTPATSFEALTDVDIDDQTLAGGQVPTYNATTQKWENKTLLENSLTSSATDKALTAEKGKDLQDNKQPKTLATPITVNGTSQTTVEEALGGLNVYSNTIKSQKIDISQIAYQNTNETTASKAYSEGEYFINANGEFCQATTAIATDATLTENTNFIKTNIGNEIGSVASQSITPDSYDNDGKKFTFYRCGKIVYFCGAALDATLPTGFTTIFTSIPSKYRPIADYTMRGNSDTGNPTDSYALFINSSGSIAINRYTKNTSNTVLAFAISGCYIAKN